MLVKDQRPTVRIKGNTRTLLEKNPSMCQIRPLVIIIPRKRTLYHRCAVPFPAPTMTTKGAWWGNNVTMSCCKYAFLNVTRGRKRTHNTRMLFLVAFLGHPYNEVQPLRIALLELPKESTASRSSKSEVPGSSQATNEDKTMFLCSAAEEGEHTALLVRNKIVISKTFSSSLKQAPPANFTFLYKGTIQYPKHG